MNKENNTKNIIENIDDRILVSKLLNEIQDRSLQDIFRELLLGNRVNEVGAVIREHRPEVYKIIKQYARNEAINAHSENLLLLAKNFGTKDDISFCQELIRTRDKNGGLTIAQSREGFDKIHVKLYPILKKLKAIKSKVA